jgi:mannonate dehydratase
MQRRAFLQALTAAAAPAALAQSVRPRRVPEEGENTPKICAQIGSLRYSPGGFDEAGMRRIKQLGVNYVLTSEAVKAPWEEGALKAAMAKLTEAGLTLYHMYLPGPLRRTTFGEPGRDEEIEAVIKAIQVAGTCGVKVLEYNWYGHRAQEGYYGETARGGSGITSFDYDKVKDLPPQPNVGVHSEEQLWNSITYFLKAVIPAAEKAGVRLSLHPNDPPVPISRGSGQIVATVDGWKRLIEIVDSPSNGITYDCGVTWETGAEPVEVCRYFGSRDRINHVHFRNVIMRKPREKYSEVFIDAGEVNMFAVMKELVQHKYKHLIHPEHPRALDYDTQQPGFAAQYPGGGGYAGWAFNVAYTRALLQAALDT